MTPENTPSPDPCNKIIECIGVKPVIYESELWSLMRGSFKTELNCEENSVSYL